MRGKGMGWALTACCALAATAARANVDISASPTKNMSCGGGICAPTAKNAVLNVDELAAMLAASDVTVTSGTSAQTIRIGAPLQWASTHTLTLDAEVSVHIKAPVTVQGQGGLTIAANDDDYGGNFQFFAPGCVTFADLSGRLTINGVSYALAGDVAGLAGAIAAEPDGAFALARDYDAAADGTHANAPVKTEFEGRFTGLGHRIANLSIAHGRSKDPVHIGLFGLIGHQALVRDIALVDANISSQYKWADVGALAGENTGIVEYASATGMMTGSGSEAATGGLVGWNNAGRIVSSTAAAQVSSAHWAGGLVGANWQSVIASSGASGTVQGGFTSASGGLLGQNYRATVEYSFADASNAADGGLVGTNDHQGTVRQSYAFGTATCSYGCAGLVSYGDKAALVEDSYSSRAIPVAGGGGLIGTNHGKVKTAYASGALAVNDLTGGLIARDFSASGYIKHGYWDTDTTGVTDPSQGAGNIDNDPGIKALSDAQFQAQLPAGFKPAVWGQDARINGGLPYLLNAPPGSEAARRAHLSRLHEIIPAPRARRRDGSYFLPAPPK